MSRLDMASELTREEQLGFMEGALKAQLAMIARERDPTLPPVTFTDRTGEVHEIDAFISLLHASTGNLFQGFHISERRLCSLIDTMLGTMAERNPEGLRDFLTQMIVEHLPDTVSPKIKASYELMMKMRQFMEEHVDDDSKTNVGDQK